MLLDRVLPLGLVLVGAKAQRLHAGVDRAVGVRQHRVRRRVVDGRVDARVQAVVARQVAPREAGHHFVVQRAHLGQLLVGDALGRQLARHALEHRQHLEGVEHVGLGELHRHRAAVGQQVDQPLGRQQLDGLAQRRARHVQLQAQLAFVELGAGRDAPLHQHGAQARHHLVMQGQPGDFDDFSGHVRFPCLHFECKK
ncbi:hypothetical protein D3C72_1493300 [compost metagenome]